MDINIRPKEDDFLCVVGHHYKEGIRIEVYGYDDQGNQILFDLSIEQAKDLKKQLDRKELNSSVKE